MTDVPGFLPACNNHHFAQLKISVGHVYKYDINMTSYLIIAKILKIEILIQYNIHVCT